MTKIEQKIPEGWSVKKLGDFMIFKNGLNAEKGSYGSGIKFVNTMDIFNNTYLYEKNIIGSVNVNERKLNENSVIYGDVLFNRTSEIPEEIACSSVYLDTSKITFGGFIIRGRPKSNILSPKFSVYCFKSGYFRKEAIRRCQGAIRSNIGQEDLSKIFLLLPPLAEQEKIAGILGTWDEAIEKLSSLIEHKKLLKKGLMQRLLTGKTRLNGFTQPWKEVKLGEITEFKKGKQLNKLDMIDERLYPVLNGGISYSGYTNNWNTDKDTITISEGGNSCGFVSYIQEKFWSGGHCYTLDKIKVDKLYLYQLLKFEENNLMKLRVGSGLPNIQLSSLNKFKVNIPSDIAEQKAIADVLSTADEEINLLNQKLEALKEQKKGLMQQLLTGQTRVKVN